MATNIDRREFLNLTKQGLAAWVTAPFAIQKWIPRMTIFSPPGQEPKGDILVVVFQRGGMDALNAVIPHGEAQYHDLRPTLAIDDPSTGADNTAIDLDGFFGLHPSLRPFKDIWDENALAIVHACGSPDPTHSHFDAMDYMERGTPGEKSIATGWLARHMETAAWENKSPFRAVGMGGILQSSLRGPIPVTTLQSITNFHLGGNNASDAVRQFQTTLAELYGVGTSLDDEGQLTFSATDLLESVVSAGYTPANSAEYPQSEFGLGLQQIAQLIKAEVGLEIACVDIGGWDTHAAQGALDGVLPSLLDDFSRSLAAFYKDLGTLMSRVTVVTMSEFGRRLQENGNGGTDHGHGGVMFLMGQNVNGGKVHGRWPGLSTQQLYGPGDLEITSDYRDVLGEIVQKRLMNDKLDLVFPNYTNWQTLGVAKG